MCDSDVSVYRRVYDDRGVVSPSGYLSHSESPFDKSTSRVRVKIDGLRLVGGNPDFTNAPGHGDDDARFYDRQQAYVHARGG